MKWVLLLSGLVYSQSFKDALDFDRIPGSASYEMLKLEKDARTAAMAGGGVSLPGRAIAATEVNPASAVLDSFKLHGSHGLPFKE